MNDNLYSLDRHNDDEAYKHDKEQMLDSDVNWVNKMYDRAKPYLDNDFHKEFPKNYNSRYCELVVANQMLNSQYGGNLVPKSKQEIRKNKKDAPSIDFKIILPDHLPYGLAIECVCPNFGENIISDNGNFKYSKHYSDSSVHYSESGENWHIMSRFANCISNKVKQFEDCITNGTIEDKSYKLLVVSGATLLREESKRRGLKLPSLRYPFVLALEGIPKGIFSNDGSTPRFINVSYAIEKKEGVLIDYEILKKGFSFFDGIIYFEDTPFKSSSPPFYHCFVKEEIKEIINKIFPAD